MKKNKKKITIALSIIFLILVIGGLYASGVFKGVFQAVNFKEVYKVNYGNVQCVKNQVEDYGYFKYIDDSTNKWGKGIYKCDSNDIYTDKCRVIIKIASDLGALSLSADGKWAKCSSSNVCNSPVLYTLRRIDTPIIINDILPGEYIKTYPDSITTLKEDMTIGEVKASTWYLQDTEHNRVIFPSTKGCILSDELKSKVETAGLNQLGFSPPNNVQNYIVDFVQTATNTYTYNGQEVICSSRDLYSIIQKKFKDGSTKNFQGNLVKSGVVCCPQENNCDPETFTFKSNLIKTCPSGQNYECPNSGAWIADPSKPDYKFRYECIDYNCKLSSSVKTECTSNQACITKYGSGYVCDFSPANWGVCSKSSKIGTCGDGTCDNSINENTNSCPKDCANGNLQCPSFYVPKLVSEKKYDWWDYIGLGKPEIVQTQQCVLSPIIPLVIIVVAVLIFLIILVLLLVPKKAQQIIPFKNSNLNM